MVTIGLRFLAGRYHATPWGRHVNEGVAEWPPSPWRLLRALVAVCRRARPDVSDDQLGELLQALSRAPTFRLPAATVANTRHFMPLFAVGDRTGSAVLDTFVALDREVQVRVNWDVELSPAQEALLGDLVGRLPYLGRAESWCEASLVPGTGEPNCWPIPDGSEVPVGCDAIRVLTPRPVGAPELLEAMLVETGNLRSRQRKLEPPGSTWALYARDRGALVSHPPVRRRPSTHRKIQAVRYALDSKPLPAITTAFDVGDVARQAIMSLHGNHGTPSWRFSGRGASGHLTGGHRHAFYLATDDDDDGRIDHLTVWSPTPFSDDELEALGRLRRLWDGRRELEIDLMMLGSFTTEQLVKHDPGGYFGPAQRWESVTPYMLTRHPKRYRDGRPKVNEHGQQVDGPEDQIRREWDLRRLQEPSLPELEAISPKAHHAVGYRLRRDGGDGPRRIRWLEYRRRRRGGGQPAMQQGLGFTLEFAAPVPGPLALGYGCHFGLGLFRPVPLVS